jgi:hypothetical protein
MEQPDTSSMDHIVDIENEFVIIDREIDEQWSLRDVVMSLPLIILFYIFCRETKKD